MGTIKATYLAARLRIREIMLNIEVCKKCYHNHNIDWWQGKDVLSLKTGESWCPAVHQHWFQGDGGMTNPKICFRIQTNSVPRECSYRLEHIVLYNTEDNQKKEV